MAGRELTRRAAMTAGGAALLAAHGPSNGRTLAMAEDLPGLTFEYEAIVTLKPTVEIGRSPRGIRRRIDITGGTFAGPRIRGTVLAGGADWQLQRGDNWTVIEADYMMRADDGTYIHVRNVGLTNSRVPGVSTRYLRAAPVFEVPEGPHEWLNQALFISTLGPAPDDAPKPSVRIRVYRVT
ncbi:DUF3237 domain-containing protein [Sphingomonas sp. BGYR3]|uniref:DUF3237 domain-containing protein n=1 Tax=Sphingomonas sp. BGYR3 TaxID=2975483 RepID=UPI0021A8C28C|nr:DUF3237 domain-containing protein [Sphingomonas sp. BGYR3]